MNVSQELKQRAVQIGLCTQWTEEWGEPDKHELCEKYVKGIDFCIEHNYPNTEYMKHYFDGIMQEHGIFVDEALSLVNPKMVIANGKCSGIVSFKDFGVGTMYVRHDSEIKIEADGFSKVFISVYDNAKVEVVQKENAKVYVYLHGGKVKKTGEVLVRKRGG